jgi:hypothetical protein
MKVSGITWIAAALLVVVIASCEKSEQASLPKQDLKKHKLSVPLADGRTFIEMNATAPFQMNRQEISSSRAFTQILVPDLAYRNSTTLIGLEKVADFSIINCTADSKLKITFIDSVQKMSGYPNGWTALWNSKPNVEDETPPVLYTRQRNRLTIMLSKYVTTFGFELAPNLYETFPFSVGFYDSQQNPPVASLQQTASTPSGAKLFAVCSPKPFNVIEISFSGNDETENHPYGFALANIRYKLAK